MSNNWIDDAREIFKVRKIDTNNLKNKYKCIYFPWSDEYEKTDIFQQLPLIIIKPINILELQDILDYAHYKKCSISMIQDKILTEIIIIMSNFNTMSINRNILTVGGGVTYKQINKYLFDNDINYYSIFQDSPHESNELVLNKLDYDSGNLRRMYGLAIDLIESISITVPPTRDRDSMTLSVSRNQLSDLFWALCGGKASNFGYISEIKYKLIIVNNVMEYNILWDGVDNMKKIIDFWSETSISRPNEYTENININNNSISLNGLYIVPDKETESESNIKISKTLESLVNETNGVLTIKRKMKENVKKIKTPYSIFSDIIDSESITNDIDKNNCSIKIDLLGGNITTHKTGIFPFRNSNFLINYNTDKHLIPFSYQYYYSYDYDKLVDIKYKYDPLKVLSYSGIKYYCFSSKNV